MQARGQKVRAGAPAQTLGVFPACLLVLPGQREGVLQVVAVSTAGHEVPITLE